MAKNDNILDYFDPSKPLNLSFAGCGFLGIYHVGVASCIKQYAPHLVTGKLAGASAGALAATGLVCNCDLGEATTQVLDIALQIRALRFGAFNPTFCLKNFVKNLLDSFLPFNAHTLAHGRLHISMTCMDGMKLQNIVVNEFHTRNDLIEALICSSFIPIFCGTKPPAFRGQYCMDGGLSNNIPRFDDNTITVSPFAGETDICPIDVSAVGDHFSVANTSVQLTIENLYRMQCIMFPPSPEKLAQMCYQGFQDCLRFLKRHNLISCTRHVCVHAIVPTNTFNPEMASSDSSASQMDVGEGGKEAVRVTSRGSCYPPEQSDDEEYHGTGQCYPRELWSDEEDTDDEFIRNVVDHHLGEIGISDLENECKTMSCADCSQVRTEEKNLPVRVRTALKQTCDKYKARVMDKIQVKNMYNSMIKVADHVWYPTNACKYLGKLVMVEWVPHLPMWMLRILNVVTGCCDLVNSTRHRYSARFACQFAVTELEDAMSDPRHFQIDFITDDIPETFTSLRHYLARLYHELTSSDHLTRSNSICSDCARIRDAARIAAQIKSRKRQREKLMSEAVYGCLTACNQNEAILAFHYTNTDGQTCLRHIYPADAQINIANITEMGQHQHCTVDMAHMSVPM